MAGEMHQTLERLKEITKTNLAEQFEKLNGFCASSIKHANSCDIPLSLRYFVLAELSAKRLRDDAVRNLDDGLITKERYTDISEMSLNLVFDELSEEISNGIVKSCACARGEVEL